MSILFILVVIVYLYTDSFIKGRGGLPNNANSTKLAQKDLKSTDKIERDKYINHKD